MKFKQLVHRGMDLHGVDYDTLLNSKIDIRVEGKNKWFEFEINGFKEVINIANE